MSTFPRQLEFGWRYLQAKQLDFGWSYPPGCNGVPDDDNVDEFELDDQESDLPIVADDEPEFDPSYDTEEETEPPWA